MQLESSLLNSLQSSLVNTPFSYELKKNYPLLSKSNVTVQPQTLPSGSVYGKRLNYFIPRNGLLTGMCIKIVTANSATKTATLVNQTRLGARFFSQVDIKSHNRTIQTNDQYYIDNRISTSPTEKANGYLNLTSAQPDIDVSGTTAASTFFTPLFFWFGERSENALDTEFVEPLQIECVVNSSANIWGDDELLFAPTFTSCELICFYTNLENQTRSSLVASQFPLSKNLTMLISDSYEEVQEDLTITTSLINAGETTITLDVKVNSVVSGSMLSVKNKDTGALIPIKSVTLVSSGRTLVDSTRETNIYENAQYNKFINNVPGSSTGVDMYPIYYGYDSDLTYVSGSQAFKSLNAPRFTVTIDTSSGITNGDVCALTCQHNYFTLLTIDSNNGAISRNISD